MKRFTPLLIFMLTSACAGQQALRSTSAQTAAILNQYRASFREFAARQTELNVANEERIGQLTAMRNQRQAEIDSRKMSWSLAGDDEAMRRFGLLTSVRAEQILAQGSVLTPLPAAVPSSPLKFDASSVDGIIKQLVVLQEPPGLAAQARDILTFGTELRSAYQTAVKQASDQSGEAATATENTAAAENDAAAPSQ